jgi:23S rRNA G2445 N2-methylase RlmL
MRFLATAVRGTERILMEELIELGFEAPTMVPGGVVFTGTIADGMRSCLWLRTAQRVMALIGKEVIRAQSQLYDAVRSLPLLDWFTADATISVQVQGGRELFAATCVACHGERGAGQPNVVPPLRGSPYVLGDDARLVRIVTHGLTGPIEVRGQLRKQI